MPYPVYSSYTAPTPYTASSASAQYLVPFVSSADLSAGASVNTITQQAVSIADIDVSFAATLSEADSASLLNSFTVSGWGPDGSFNVTLGNGAALSAVLTNALVAATRGGSSINQWFNGDIAGQLAVQIESDGLVNSVENSYATVDSTLDASGAAQNVSSNFNDPQCEMLYQQIPATTLNLYMDASEEPITPSMPMKNGDVLVVVWQVSPSAMTVVFSNQANGAAAGDNASGNAAGAGYADAALINYTPGSRRIALYLTLTGTDTNGKVTGIASNA